MNANCEMVEIHVLCVTVKFNENPKRKWQVKLDENAKVGYYEDKYAAVKFSPSIIRRENDKNLS